MKKIFLVGVFLLVFFLTSGIASAHRVFFGFGFFPPVIVSPPPAIVVSPPAYYPYPTYPPYPYGYYRPGYYGYRVWMPGYWDTIWTDRGW